MSANISENEKTIIKLKGLIEQKKKEKIELDANEKHLLARQQEIKKQLTDLDVVVDDLPKVISDLELSIQQGIKEASAILGEDIV